MFYVVTFGYTDAEEGTTLVVEALNAEAALRDETLLDRMDCASTLVGESMKVLSVNQTIRWVNAYSIERAYGGPEEGGWWYDHYECLASAPAQNQADADYIGDVMRRALAWENPRSRYSVIGGPDFSLRVEDDRAARETTETPHYE